MDAPISRIKGGIDMTDNDWDLGRSYLHKEGYVIMYKYENGRQVTMMQHIFIYEQVHGKVPKDYHVHHINGVRNDNRIENLMCVDCSTHKRIHEGWEIINGEWYKLCKKCQSLKKANTDNFYLKPRPKFDLCYICIPCYREQSKQAKRLYRLRKKEIG